MPTFNTRTGLRLAATAAIAGALAVAGCSSASSTGRAGSSGSGSHDAAKVPLVVYSAQGYDHAMVAAFQKATGIPVKLDDNSTGPLLTQIEASKNNPNWGLLWVDGATAFAGLGQEYEDAARVHGADRIAALRLIWPMLAPAIWSALAINFAEAISDFGVAATLAYNSNFTLGTYQLYAAINNFPPSFPAASAMGALLVAAVAIPLALQARALRGRSYQMLSGRTRQAVRRQLSIRGKAAAVSGMTLFYVVALGVPGFGAVSASLLGDFGGSYNLTLVNYRALLHQQADQIGPLERSLAYGAIAATVTVIGGFIAAWLLAQRREKSSRVLDFLLLAAVALPSVVFAAGYIFAFNLPLWSSIGINLYQTATLLVIAYIASSLPTNARVLVGAVSQLQPSLRDAARTHGAGEFAAWARGVLPVVSRPLTMAWLLTFCGVFLELPISQLLYAPSNPPASVAIQDNLGNYHFGVGMAQSVFAVAIALLAVALVLGGYRLLAPAGWRRIGAASRG